jgi:hypothetical protein
MALLFALATGQWRPERAKAIKSREAFHLHALSSNPQRVEQTKDKFSDKSHPRASKFSLSLIFPHRRFSAIRKGESFQRENV